MNGFTKKIIATRTLGEKLQKIRSDRRISLGEVSRYTQIRTDYLESLERGDYESLPAEVYVKGFLRSYAYFLGLDENILLRLYDKEREIKKNIRKEKKEEGVQVRKGVNISPFLFTPQKIAILAIFLAIFSGIFFLYREIDSFASNPSLVVINPQEGSEINGNSVYAEGITDPDASIFINDQPIFVGEEGKFGENLTLKGGLNTISIKAMNKFKKETVQNISVFSFSQENIPEQEKEALSGGQEAQNEKAEKIKMEIRVDPGPVWLSVEADGNLVFSGTMLSGATQSFEASEKIVINSGKGNATFAKFNGKDIGPLSKDPGAIREATFTKDTRY